MPPVSRSGNPNDPVLLSFDTSTSKRWVVKAAFQRIGSCHNFVSGDISVSESSVTVVADAFHSPFAMCIVTHASQGKKQGALCVWRTGWGRGGGGDLDSIGRVWVLVLVLLMLRLLL